MPGVRESIKSRIPTERPHRPHVRDKVSGVNRAAGLVGKGRTPSNKPDAALDHQSAPLSSLRDPDSFGPPPKNANFYGGQGGVRPPPQITSGPSSGRSTPATSTRSTPPLPSRTNTGSSSIASSAPRLPARRPTDNTASPVVAESPGPSLPPRLPSRPAMTESPPPPTYEHAVATEPEPAGQPGQLNQGAMGRLGRAGVAVPGLNIGSGQGNASEGAQMNELQSRFSRMNSSADAEKPAQGTSWAQKQAALKSAQSFHKDPSSINLSDARDAASTANNFRQRHGAEVAQGARAANSFNQKYGVADRVGMGNPQGQTDTPPVPATRAAPPPRPAGKKPPPPPPKKKAFAAPPTAANSDAGGGGPPPPVPLSSKPKPS